MTKSKKSTSTAVALNSEELLSQIKKEVQDEFVTSNQEVYKAGLRSLIVQEQKLQQQITSINAEIAQLHEARAALDEAFRTGVLHSVTDARGVVRKVNSRINVNDFDADDI